MHDCGVPKTFSIFGESGAHPSTYYQTVLFGTRTRVVSAKGVRFVHGFVYWKNYPPFNKVFTIVHGLYLKLSNRISASSTPRLCSRTVFAIIGVPQRYSLSSGASCCSRYAVSPMTGAIASLRRDSAFLRARSAHTARPPLVPAIHSFLRNLHP